MQTEKGHWFGFTPHNTHTGYFLTWSLQFEGSSPPFDPQNCQNFHVNGNVKFPAFLHASSHHMGAFPQVRSSNLNQPVFGIDSAEARPSFTPIITILALQCKLRHLRQKLHMQPIYGGNQHPARHFHYQCVTD